MKHGVLNVLKPPGLTSHDVVSHVRRALGTKRVGHTGTLDPAAAGVLPICVGHATRLAEYLSSDAKSYRAEMTFGFQTDSLDALGKIIARGDASQLKSEQVGAVLEQFRGAILQAPPMFSAIKRDGKKLYELARAGEEIEIEARPVTISKLELTRFETGNVDNETNENSVRAWLDIECSSGTYIRSLVRDIGHAVGVPATMTFLVRTRSGRFDIENAVLMDAIAAESLTPFAQCALWCAVREEVSDAAVQKLARGQKAQLNSAHAVEHKRETHCAETSMLQRVLVRDQASTTFVLALPATPEANAVEGGLYQPEKVFLPDNSVVA